MLIHVDLKELPPHTLHQRIQDHLLRDPLTSLQIVKSGVYMPDKTSHHFWQPLYFFQNILYHVLVQRKPENIQAGEVNKMAC